jgi:TonB family protein
LQPSDYPLNLLLTWPNEGSASHWAKILGASLVVHLLFFLVAIRLPSFAVQNEPESRVVQHRIPLYVPRDIMTQRAPNKQKVAKQVDLEDLLALDTQRAQAPSPAPSVKHFELPKQGAPKPAQTTPQILPTAPDVAANQTPAPLPTGAPNGLAQAPPPAPAAGPFQNIGTEAPNPHPTLAPPKTSVQAAINGASQNATGRQIVISDDSPTQPLPGAPGASGQIGAQHSAVELQSDPQGVDFRPYLARILAIVRANWRRVIPESVRMGTLRGRTVVEFIINRDGSIPKLVTAEPSGFDPLDRAAVAGLSMSNPLPPLPTDYKGMQVRLAFSFAYNMPSQ